MTRDSPGTATLPHPLCQVPRRGRQGPDWNGAHSYPITALAKDAKVTPETLAPARMKLSHELESKENGVDPTYTGEPLVSGWRRFGLFLMSLLPIEGQL